MGDEGSGERGAKMADANAATVSPALKREASTVEALLGRKSGLAKLLLWRDMQQSGAVFAAGTVAYLIIRSYSLVSLVCTLSYIMVGLCYGGAKVFPSKFNAFAEQFPSDIPSEVLHKQADRLAAVIPRVLGFCRKIVLGKDVVTSVKAFVALYGASVITNTFSISFMAYLVFLAAFTLPKVYEANEEQCDVYLNTAFEKVKEVMSQVDSKIPKAKAAVEN